MRMLTPARLVLFVIVVSTLACAYTPPPVTVVATPADLEMLAGN